MDYELYIHIGYPKTASTLLQVEIFPKLKGVNFIFPQQFQDSLNKILRENEFSFDYQEVKKNLEKCFNSKKNLISSEGLIGSFSCKQINSKLIADRLLKMFPKARIIVVIRNQYDLMRSVYCQYVHEGGTRKFRDFINFRNGKFHPSYNFNGSDISIELFDYTKILNYYSLLFGKDNVLVIPYELLLDNPDYFVKRMLSWMGTKETFSLQNLIYNRGYGVRRLKIARFFNRFLFNPNNKEHKLIPNIKFLNIGKINSKNMRKILQSKTLSRFFRDKPLNDAVVKSEIKRLFRKSNKVLNQTYDLSLEEKYYKYYF